MKRRTKQIFLIVLILFTLFTQVFTVVKGLGLVKDVKLYGVVPKISIPKVSSSGVTGGSFQRGVDAWLLNNIGLRGTYIKLENQINYSFFSFISGSPSVILGKNRWLYENAYVDTYNYKDVIPVAKLEERIRDMAELQLALASHGIPFLFLITPSKPSIYPEYLDPRLISPDRDKIKGNYDNAVPLLKKYNINYLDGRAYYLDRKAKDPLLLFPSSGTHWNYYSCRYFTEELIGRLEKISKKKFFGICDDGMIATTRPFETDKDLARLTNLILVNTFNTHYYYPIVKCLNVNDIGGKITDNEDIRSVNDGKDCYYYAAIKRTGGNNCFQPKMLAVGGSFMHTVFYYLDLCAFYRERDFYYYYSTNFAYPENTRTPLNKENFDLRTELLKSDVILIESNEQAMGNIGFGFIGDALKALGK